MSIQQIGRRRFLTLCFGGLLPPLHHARAEPTARRASYAVDVGILYEMLSFKLAGTIDERIDREANRYQVTAAGQGANIANRIESSGVLHGGRWSPTHSRSYFQVHGRESRTELKYDHARRVVEYHARGETFFLRRLRVVDDLVSIPEGQHVDDPISALLNYADGLWPAQADGVFRTHVVRRRRTEGEGPDDVAKVYRGELVPFELRVVPEPGTGRLVAVFDLTRFSSWARRTQPARVVFGDDRRPALITGSMILGTSITIRLASA